MTKVKTLLKFTIAGLLYFSGVSWIALRIRLKREKQPIILMYHRILPDNDPGLNYSQAGIVVSKGTFEAQMKFIKQKFPLISISDYAREYNSQRVSSDYLIVTFDDGWKDNFQYAFPILKQLGIPATIFLTVDFIASKKELWFYQILKLLKSSSIARQKLIALLNDYQSARQSDYISDDELIEQLKNLHLETILAIINKIQEDSAVVSSKSRDSETMLDWSEIAIMAESGIDFGSHGLSHSIITLLNEEQIWKELSVSKSAIEEKLHKPVLSYAYPNGNYNESIQVMVKKAGYLCAAATRGDNSSNNIPDILALRRVGIHTDIIVGPRGNFSKAMFMMRISGLDKTLGKLFSNKV